MSNSITAADLAALTDDRLRELGDSLERLAWQLVRRPAGDPAYVRVEQLVDLVEAEEERRFGPA